MGHGEGVKNGGLVLRLLDTGIFPVSLYIFSFRTDECWPEPLHRDTLKFKPLMLRGVDNAITGAGERHQNKKKSENTHTKPQEL